MCERTGIYYSRLSLKLGGAHFAAAHRDKSSLFRAHRNDDLARPLAVGITRTRSVNPEDKATHSAENRLNPNWAVL